MRWLRAWGHEGERPTVEELRRWLDAVRRDEQGVTWLIDAQGPVGVAGIRDMDRENGRATTHIVIGERTRWRQGIATEAIALRTAYAFDVLGLNKLKTRSLADNVAMRRALSKNGYREIGIERREYFRGGVCHDAWAAELRREEWERYSASGG